MVCLVALHVLLAAVDLSRKGFFPGHLIHRGYAIVIDQAHFIRGYLPQVARPGPIGQISKVIIDGRRGPELQWSHPRAVWKELTQGRLSDLWSSKGYMSNLPLPFFLPAVVHKISGGSIMAISLAPQLFVALLLFSVYGIARRAGGPWLGVAAAAIASGYPGIYQLARSHHDSLATTAMSAAVICLIMYSRGFTRLWICALAGIAVYISTLVSESVASTALIGVIVAGPFAMEYVRLIGRCRSRKVDMLWGMVGLALVLAPVCLLFNWERVFHLIVYGQSSWVEVSSYSKVGSHVPESLKGIVAFFAYFFRIGLIILKPVMTFWLVLGAALLWRAPRGERLAVALSVAVPLVLLSVMPKRADGYIVPICAGLALVTALGLRGFKSLMIRRWAMGLAAACGLMMPLFFILIPPHYRDLVDLNRISPLIKGTVTINELPLDHEEGWHPHDRTAALPIAAAARELVEYDLKNTPRSAGPRRVALFGGGQHKNEAFRYMVELAHPSMFVLDFLNDFINRQNRRLMLDEVKADQFDYLIFSGDSLDSGLNPFPPEGWDPLRSRLDVNRILMIGDDPQIRTDKNTHMIMDGGTQAGQRIWNARFRRFVKELLARRWKRIELSTGPIYQAVEAGHGTGERLKEEAR